MLKGIDQRLSAEIVHVLMLMGHGDDLVICDVNHPAVTIAKETTYGALVDMSGCNLLTAAEAILSLMPLDTFVSAPVARMQVVGDAGKVLPLFSQMQATCSRIEGREVPGGDLVELAVADDGPGIPTEAAERVFERFYRVDTARSREQGGTGLGLSIVKHIIQAHGGEVRLETAPGKGAAFRFTLPAVPPPVMGK